MPYQRQEYFEPSSVNTGSAALYGTLAERLQAFSQQSQGIYEGIAIPQAEQAGMAAADAGETKLRVPIGNVNRAYNDALVRSYALDAYADVHEKFSQFEVEAGTDQEKFKSAVAGYKSGTLPSMLPAAQPIIAQAMQQRELEGSVRIGTLKANETRAEAIAQSERGLTTLQDQISRGYTAGDPDSIARADALAKVYIGNIDGNVAAGLYTKREGEAKTTAFYKDVTRQVAFGQLEAELDNPNGDAVGVIQRTLDSASSLLSDDEQMELTGNLLQRLNTHQAVAAEASLQAQGDLRAQWAAGEKKVTQLLLRGRLTNGMLEQMVTDDQLDPGIARTLRDSLKSGNAKSDPETEFLYRTNLLEYTEQEIRDEPKLSFEDKAALIEKRRTSEGGWQDSNPAQEAKGRIDRALGMTPGTPAAMLSEAQLRARGRALTSWYDQVEALPEAERVSGSIKIADQVIQEVVIGNKAIEAAQLQRRRDAYTKGKVPEDMGKTERAKYEENLKRLDDAIARSRSSQ